MLRLETVSKIYEGRSGFLRTPHRVQALREVSLHIREGESYGLVGESGSGKTTLTRCILRLEPMSAGRIFYRETDIAGLSGAALTRWRSKIQIVFQDPYASLNPRMCVRDIVTEPMWIHRAHLGWNEAQRRDRCAEILTLVGLGPQHFNRYPHEFSGGQRQRICIARALATQPECLILDEPTSALDVSVQAQILNLLDDLQKRLRMTYLFISHDLGVIRHVCDRVGLLYRGDLVEEQDTGNFFAGPQTEYGRNLLSFMPGAALAKFRADTP